MIGWNEIASLGAKVRPLTDPKPPPGNRYSPFSASLTSTLELLYAELRALNAENVVLELGLRERDIRIDGLPRADARPGHDGVAVSFDSKHGPLRYATAEYSDRWSIPAWQANLRAIALSMQALRAVDRYGVSKRGEQYKGWKQLPRSSDPADQIITAEDARAFLDEHGGSFTEAAKRLHPDRGGDEGKFRAAVKARELLGAS